MRDSLTPAAKKISKSHKRRLAWKRFVQSMAMIVVFCTTYALILPAITMHSDLICGLESHVHTDECYQADSVTELVCTLPEHAHTDSCYPVESEEPLSLEYRCGYAQHVHGDNCTDEDGNLTCTISEHIHKAECVVDNVDLTADLESAADWERMAAELDMNGSWAQDLLTMAESQIGYAESEQNCVLAGDQIYGYTRYSDWYGNPYLEWDALFVAFCLHYAGIPETAIPVESDTQQWFALLEQKNLLSDVDDKLPEPGDVVFCKDGNNGLYAAVVQSATAENSNLDALGFRVIAGDRNNQVETTVVAMDRIVGVCDMTLVQGVDGGTVEIQASDTAVSLAPETETTEKTVYTAETDNYIVTVTCAPDLVLPQGAQLRVMEYSKDSQIYLQRCQEAGYELEWLLNIGFFLGDEELYLNGNFDVVVTCKDGGNLGQDITHFADTGVQRINGQEDESSVSFTSDGFSDFGGGIALAAESGVAIVAADATAYQFTTTNPAQLQTGVDYAIYCRNGNNVTFLNSGLSAITAQARSDATNIGRTWTLSADQMGTANSAVFTWRVVRQNGSTYLVCQENQQRLTLHNGWLQLTNEGTALTIAANGAGAIVGGTYKLRYDDQWRGTWTNDQGTYTTEATTVYFASVNAEGPNYPHAVHTGEVDVNRLRFYNLCENGDSGVSALAGCVFEITGDNGYKATVVSGSDPEVNLPADLPDGRYTITEVSVPEGYLKDTEHIRTFEVRNGALVSDRTIGTFINHNIEQLVADKTAEVEDYVNRIYQVNISAESNMRIYEMDPIDVLFVVDQSNSMLFPSGLVDTGKKVTLRLDGTNNARNLDALNLDKSQMHYIIADPTGTSTVWCVWHDGTAWMCQDASYYAKAKHNNDPGYQDDNETVIFPSNRSYADQSAAEGDGIRSNGAGLAFSQAGSSLGKDLDAAPNDTKTYTLYTSTDEFNRLHYLEEALSNLIYQLADVNDENRITLTRFTKEVLTSDCFGPLELNPDNTDYLVEQVTSIKTSGGTRQDIALKHVYEEHLNDTGDHYSDIDHTYTLLITDGAPVLSSNGGLTNLGGPNDAATTTGDTVYGQIKGWANQVKRKSTLMTVGLGMESVEAGKDVLEQIASNDNFYCALDDASELLSFVQRLLFESFRPKQRIEIEGDIVDEISDSFYPIAWVNLGNGNATGNRVLLSDSTRDWVLLEENDWITLDGKLTTAGAADAAGQLLRKTDGTFYVQWNAQNLSDDGWEGIFYVKAKEDFIGGNAIDTNKSASVRIPEAEVEFETPTVNVRLLDLNEMNSEVTVYLGDQVNGEGDAPVDSLRYFYENTRFTKLISGDGDVLNKVSINDADGLEAAVFYLRYAMGADLTEEQWQRLLNGDSIEVEYTYDDASSHGSVGCFTFQLTKEGLGSSYSQHEAVSDCQPGGQPLTEACESPAETYTLNVTYRAYKLGENGRPKENVHNGTAGPGREVGNGTVVENGLGTLVKDNVHEVHVISGTIEIFKRFVDGITDENDRTFTFTLHRLEDGDDTSKDVTKTITIPSDRSEGNASIVFDGLRRGTYTVTEAVDEDYSLRELTVLNTTNCYSEPSIGATGTELIFVMGNNVSNTNVIGKYSDTDRYTIYTDPVNGVYGAAQFSNAPTVYSAEIPVEKIWPDPTIDHSQDAVYVVLYLNDVPVLDGEGNARILRLDASSGWKGIFTVALIDRNDSLENYDYSIREVSQVRTTEVPDWYSAILENDGTTHLYYEKALEEGMLLHISNKGYRVEYGTGEDGQLTATNSRAVDLPMTGGMGTHMFTFSGLLLIAAALMIGCSQRRKKERRTSA